MGSMVETMGARAKVGQALGSGRSAPAVSDEGLPASAPGWVKALEALHGLFERGYRSTASSLVALSEPSSQGGGSAAQSYLFELLLWAGRAGTSSTETAPPSPEEVRRARAISAQVGGKLDAVLGTVGRYMKNEHDELDNLYWVAADGLMNATMEMEGGGPAPVHAAISGAASQVLKLGFSSALQATGNVPSPRALQRIDAFADKFGYGLNMMLMMAAEALELADGQTRSGALQALRGQLAAVRENPRALVEGLLTPWVERFAADPDLAASELLGQLASAGFMVKAMGLAMGGQCTSVFHHGHFSLKGLAMKAHDVGMYGMALPTADTMNGRVMGPSMMPVMDAMAKRADRARPDATTRSPAPAGHEGHVHGQASAGDAHVHSHHGHVHGAHD